MAASRRRLFERNAPEHPLTPHKLRLLLVIAECEILTVPQLAAFTGYSEKSVRNHMRDLFDLGLVNRAGVPRSALADVASANAMDLLYGRAPTIYSLSQDGSKVLIGAGMLSKEEAKDVPVYGPKNSLFLAHELQVRDVRVWLDALKKAYPFHEGLTVWKHGSDAIIDLKRVEHPKQVRPDAWFAYRFTGNTTLVGFVEIDRGTEKSPVRWQEKFTHYALLFESDLIQELTGQSRGRVLIVTPDRRRTETIAAVLNDSLSDRQLPSDRFWITEKRVFRDPDLAAPVWRVADREGLFPFVPHRLLSSEVV